MVRGVREEEALEKKFIFSWHACVRKDLSRPIRGVLIEPNH